MDKQRWVQHVSGQGEKWKVAQEYQERWDCPVPTGSVGVSLVTMLPKSEYVLCAPPERWVNVTWECEIRPTEIVHQLKDFNRIVLGTHCSLYEGYRLRKVHCKCLDSTDWSIIVEKREP